MNWKKKIGMPLLSAGLAFSAFAPGVIGHSKVPALKTFAKETAPVDLAIANDDRLIEMLKKNGTIAKDATAAEADKALQGYLHKLAIAQASTKENDTFAAQKAAITEQVKQDMASNGIKAGKGNKLGVASQNTVASVQKENWDGTQRKDEVLVLLIDYPDLKHGQLTPNETDMYYRGSDAYPHQHYQDMIFGKDGYIGPDGQKKISMKQYYEQQSGGSYTVDGEVAGWYTAAHPAAYYGAHPAGGGNDIRPRNLVYEALQDAAKDPSVDLNKYDKEDPFDLDGDGNTREPDGIIDHLMVIHSGVGEEAGGGSIGQDAIWSHSWNLGGVATIPGTHSNSPFWGGQLAGYAYTIEPEDGAAGVFSHEFGHNLGLPDEYDTLYSGSGEPVSYWSIMSSGSWTGKIPGTEPSGFSPYDKEYLQQSMITSTFTPNWQTGSQINATDVTSKGTELLLDEASSKGTNNDVVKVNLPKKVTTVNTPASGKLEYFSGSANNLNNKMTAEVDLTNAKTSSQLTFKTWYSIEKGYDFASVQVNGQTIPGDITTTDPGPDKGNPGNGITGDSNGWKTATFDLSQFKGQKVQLSFNYNSDPGVALPGFYVDDMNVTADGQSVLTDNAEGTSPFTLAGFTKDNGKKLTDHYYLLEWRSHNGSDSGLANVNRRGTMLSYDQGLVVWYVDDLYDNNWTGPGYHPGDGFLGVVDADQHDNIWHNKNWTDPTDPYQLNKVMGSNSYQMHDAAFSLNNGSNVTIGNPSFYLKDNFIQSNALFDDSQNYLNPQDPDVGRNVPKYGLKIRVVGQSADGTVGKIIVYR